MNDGIALIGFGEAGGSFARTAGWRGEAIVYDRQADEPCRRDAMIARYQAAGVRDAGSLRAAVGSGGLVLSLVTADQALPVALSAAKLIRPQTLYCDGNSVSAATKRAAAAAIEAAGACYVDMAIMAPVSPPGVAVPVLLSGAQATAAAARLHALGFTGIGIVSGQVGSAASIKMIRSIMIKGIEALSAECAMAAGAAGVLDEVIASLDAGRPDAGWAGRLDYNLDRMMLHGMRRAAEMEEVVRTLGELGTGCGMARATVERQRAVGRLEIDPPAGLAAKLDALLRARATTGGAA